MGCVWVFGSLGGGNTVPASQRRLQGRLSVFHFRQRVVRGENDREDMRSVMEKS